MYLSALTTAVLEDFKMAKLEEGYSPQTVKHFINCMMGSIKKARRDGYDCPDITAPIVKVPAHKVRFLTFDEEVRLLGGSGLEERGCGSAGSQAEKISSVGHVNSSMLIDCTLRISYP